MPNLFAFYEERVLTDFALYSSVTGEEISVHKSIIAASVPVVKETLIENPGIDKFPIFASSLALLEVVVAICYDGPLPEISLAQIFEFSSIAASLGISSPYAAELGNVKLSELIENHESEISQIDQDTFLAMVESSANSLDSREARIVVEFARKFFHLDCFSDLLRIGRNRKFPESQILFVDGLAAESPVDLASLAPNSVVHARMHNFDWTLRVEKISDHKLRVVYEGVCSETVDPDTPLGKFPCAVFDWGDKEVFVCFPSDANLQWSTSFALVARPGTVHFRASEASLSSLVLWYIAEELPELLASEDVFNKLGNVEFRAVSAFVMQRTFGLSKREASAADTSILSARDR